MAAVSNGPNQVTITGDGGATLTSIAVAPCAGVVISTSQDGTTSNIVGLASGGSYIITYVQNGQTVTCQATVDSNGNVNLRY